MSWPIRIGDPGAQTKLEKDADAYYYKQGHKERCPGDMWREMGWHFSEKPLQEMPFKSGFVWWRWGN